VPRKLRQLRADLHRTGFTSQPGRGKGSHTYWEHPLVPGEEVTLAGKDGDDAKFYQEKDVRDAVAALREAQAAQETQ